MMCGGWLPVPGTAWEKSPSPPMNRFFHYARESEPTQCEAVTMVAVQVMGNDAAIGFAASQGNFQLNVFLPVTIYNFLQSVRLLGDVMESFRKNCVVGIKANKEKMAHNLHKFPDAGDGLSPYIGYDKCARWPSWLQGQCFPEGSRAETGLHGRKRIRQSVPSGEDGIKKGVWKNPHPGCGSRATSREPKGAVKKSSTAPLFRLRQLASIG